MAYKEGEELLAALADASSDGLRAKHMNSALAMSRRATVQEYFSGEHAPTHYELHVLVEVVAEILAIGVCCDEDKAVVNERKRYRQSDMTGTIGRSVLQQLSVTLLRNQWRPPTAQAPIEEFSWTSQFDVHTKHGYKEYLRRHLRDVLEKEHLCVFGVESDSNILSAAVPGHAIDLTGRTDLLVVDEDVEEFGEDASDLPGVRMAIEVKSDEETCRKHSFQAISELVALDALAPMPVMVLLTNLTNYWRFHWTKESIVVNMILRQPSSAFQLIRTTLSMGYSAPQIEDAIELAGFHIQRKKLKLQPSSVEGEAPYSEGICEGIERYHDIASILGPDVATTREIGRQVVRSMPLHNSASA